MVGLIAAMLALILALILLPWYITVGLVGVGVLVGVASTADKIIRAKRGGSTGGSTSGSTGGKTAVPPRNPHCDTPPVLLVEDTPDGRRYFFACKVCGKRSTGGVGPVEAAERWNKE